MGPNSSRFKAAFRKLLRKPVPKHLINQPNFQTANGKMIANQLANNATPSLTFNTTLNANPINRKSNSVHTRLSRTTSNKSGAFLTKDDLNSNLKRNKLNCSLREINNNDATN